jgi:hypothetical protein
VFCFFLSTLNCSTLHAVYVLVASYRHDIQCLFCSLLSKTCTLASYITDVFTFAYIIVLHMLLMFLPLPLLDYSKYRLICSLLCLCACLSLYCCCAGSYLELEEWMHAAVGRTKTTKYVMLIIMPCSSLISCLV